MSVFYDKAIGRWRYDFVLGGVRHAKVCFVEDGHPATGRREAVAAEARARITIKIAPKIPQADELSVAQVFNDLSNSWVNTSEWENKQRQAREVMDYFGRETLVRNIDGAKIQDFIAFACNQVIMIWTGGSKKKRTDPDADEYWKPHPQGLKRSNSTVNRTLPILRAMFERAYLTRDPQTRERVIEEIPVIKDLPEPKRKARPVPDDVLVELRELVPAHVCEAMIATLYFGFRKGEAFGLQIQHVDFATNGVRLEYGEVKNNSDSLLPGGQNAMQFMAMLVDQAKARGTKNLFTWQRQYKDPERQADAPWMPVKNPKRAWKTAMNEIEKKFGKRWRWHDVRAAFITHIAITSGGIVAQKLARHSDFSTTQGYIAVTDDLTRAAAERASDRSLFTLVKSKSAA